jgi:hypothetical protein
VLKFKRKFRRLKVKSPTSGAMSHVTLAGLSPRRPEIEPRPVYVGFVVDKAALHQRFLRDFVIYFSVYRAIFPSSHFFRLPSTRDQIIWTPQSVAKHNFSLFSLSLSEPIRRRSIHILSKQFLLKWNKKHGMVWSNLYIIPNFSVTATNHVTQVCIVILPRNFVRILFCLT